MSLEFWAIIGVGVAAIDTRLATFGKGQTCIEGWIAGRLREETAS